MKHLYLILALTLSALTSTAQYTINAEYGNLTDCDTMTRGIYLVWWDNDWDYSADASEMLDSMIAYRTACLTEHGMQDPPNPTDGYFYNVYIHHGADIFPAWWANGQGTDANGYPYLTLPVGAHMDWVNVAHETFHIFQYSATSPGFSYSGDSQWYIEASANWFAAVENLDNDAAFVEGESLIRLPHVPLWLSYDNFPAYYPQNWQRYVHQYAMAMFLFYLTETADVPTSLITAGMYTGTTQMPQQYMFNQIGPQQFRQHFIDWAARMSNDFDFLDPDYVDRFEIEWENYADSWDDKEFELILTDEGTNGWHRPSDSTITTAWSFNSYKLHNSAAASYLFELNGDNTGSEGSPTYFKGQLVVQNSISGTTFHDLDMTSAHDGSFQLDVTETDTSIYFIVASMPEVFTGMDQLYGYEMQVTKGITGIADRILVGAAKEIGRVDLLGRPVSKEDRGVQFILYDNGAVIKEMQMRSR